MTPSVRPDNQFRFLCPVVGREERYIACVFRRFRHWRGEAVDCGGCAAAMDANKCPAVHMIELEIPRYNNGPVRSIFFDLKGEKVYGIPKSVVERIERVLILPFHARRYTMSPELYERLTGQVQGETAQAAFVVPDGDGAGERPAHREVRRRSARATKKPGDMTNILDDASVDLAAGINAAAD